MPRVVVALGGNALLRRGEAAEAATQQRHAVSAAAALARVAEEHDLVVTHGNGPQVGLLALEAEAYDGVRPYPLDVLGAESQGMIGYVLALALANACGRPVPALLTQVVVDAEDPAFARPTKPIGQVYDERTARELAALHGWTVAPDGPAFRRVVPSPQPREIVELDTIAALVGDGAIVVCAGGGGIPVVRRDGRLHGVEAVVDKDATAALLAESLDADRLVILTDVPCVERDWGTPQAAPLDDVSPDELHALSFAAGSMAPKIAAACRFVERTGRPAAIGGLRDLEAVVAGDAGTRVASPA
jgi:carbamate kinase